MADVIDVPDVEAAADMVAQHGPFILTSSGAVPTGNPTFEEWQAAVEWAQKVEKASPFWVGDLMVYGERYGEEASQVLEPTDYAHQTVLNAKYVCKAIPPERRNPNLSFSHHQEIAALPTPVEQDAWLQKAETENLTREQLRIQLKVHKNEGTGAPAELWVQVRCNDIDQQTSLAEELRGRGFVVRLKAVDAQ